MGAFEQYIYNKKYKLWEDVVIWRNPNNSNDVLYAYSEIKPVAGSKIKLFEVINVKVIDDVGVLGGNKVWTLYLYDFEKIGRVKDKHVFRRYKSSGNSIGNKFYDDSLDGFLGGEQQSLGG